MTTVILEVHCSTDRAARIRMQRDVYNVRVIERDAEGLLIGQAALQLGVSVDTLRRWDRTGKLTMFRDSANRRRVPMSEISRLRG